MNPHGILINRKSNVPLHRQLESALRDAILSGDLAPGERVLSSRELQTHLGLARNSILDALAQLYAEGFLVTKRGIGTFVAPHVRALARGTAKRTAPNTPSSNVAHYLSIGAMAANVRTAAPFRPGMPALDLFPAEQFRRALASSGWSVNVVDYDHPFGYEPLRAAIAQRLRQTRGIVCSEKNVVITSGAQHAFSIIAHVLVDKGDVAIVEDPGYSNIRAALLAQRARVVGAPVDDSGIVVSSFQRRRAKLVCVTPSHQYPTGAVLTLERRLALLEWAEKNDGWIVEDDYDCEFNYTNQPQPALQGLDGGRRVIYVGTFSKVLSPALRVAYAVVPNALLAIFEAVHLVSGGAPSTIIQASLARFIEAGALSRHIARTRAIYDERRQLVASELSRLAGSTFYVRDSRAGLHFVADLPNELSDVAFTERALSRGLVVPALSSYYYDNPPRNGVVIGYAATSIPQARSAIKSLVSAL